MSTATPEDKAERLAREREALARLAQAITEPAALEYAAKFLEHFSDPAALTEQPTA